MRKQAIKKNSGIKLGYRRLIAYTVLSIVSFFCLFWFFVLFINATRSHSELTKGFTIIPSTYMFQNLHNVLTGSLPVWRGMLNSLFISSCTAILCTYFSSMTAYAIHVYDFKFKAFMFSFILMIMMIPTQVNALGFIQLINKLGLDNSAIPLIIPAIASPVTFFYIKQYMESSLPLSIVEASRIDGAKEFYTMNRIVLPLMKPAIAVQMIFSFVGSWNNYFIPALILHDNEKKTLPILIAQLRGADFLKFDMGQVYMMIAFSIFPVIVIYLILSKHIVQGVVLGSVKG